MLVPGISDQLLVALMIAGAALGFTTLVIFWRPRPDARSTRQRKKAAVEGRAGD